MSPNPKTKKSAKTKKTSSRKASHAADHVVETTIAPAVAPVNDGAPRKKILIVDDEEALAKVLCNKLLSSNFDAVKAYNGKEALDMMKAKKYDGILLDILMPGKDGFSVLAEKGDTLNNRTPIFMLTNLGQEANIARCRSLGARECFVKARTSLNDLVERMRTELGVA